MDQTAYKDILTAASRKAALQGQPNGLPASKMNAKQFELLMTAAGRVRAQPAGSTGRGREEQIKKAGKKSTSPGRAWPSAAGRTTIACRRRAFLMEYDNTQNGANHIHSVWRDYEGDFGLDLLKKHYQSSHTSGATAAK